jgi:hypothetical protein
MLRNFELVLELQSRSVISVLLNNFNCKIKVRLRDISIIILWILDPIIISEVHRLDFLFYGWVKTLIPYDYASKFVFTLEVYIPSIYNKLRLKIDAEAGDQK